MKPIAVIRREELQDWNANAAFYVEDENSPLMRLLCIERLAFYAIRPDEKVLDLGCGTGATVARMISAGIDAYGVDFAPLMIEAAERKPRLEGRVVLASADDLPYDSDTFDVVVADGVLHHLAVQGRLETSLREVHRVLRPQGRLCCFDRNGSRMSGLLLRASLGAKNVVKRIRRWDHFSSSATRAEIPFGHARDLGLIKNQGFRLESQKNVAVAPLFVAVVMLNAAAYFLLARVRRAVEPLVCRIVSWFERHCAWRWFSVEQLLVWQAVPDLRQTIASVGEPDVATADSELWERHFSSEARGRASYAAMEAK